jgi:hypothetical protein
MADTKVTRASIEKANKAEGCKVLKDFLDETYGGCYEVEDGYAVPVGRSPLDDALMWVVFPYVKAKTIQSHAWGKSTRKYFDGYAEAEAYAVEVKEKADKAAERKENSKAKAERDNAARAKKKEEKAE